MAKIEERIYKHIQITECLKQTNDKGEEIGVFHGAMATQNVDTSNDIIAPEAFDDTIKEHKKLKRRVKIFYQHNTNDVPIGGIEPKNIVQEGKNWNVKGELDLNNPQAQSVYSALLKGNLTDLSINCGIADADIDKKGRRILKKLDLKEVSVVGEGANTGAKVDAVKADKSDKEDNEISKVDKYTLEDVRYISQREEFNAFLRKSGMFSRGAREHLAGCFTSYQSKSDTNKVDEDIITKKLDEVINKIKTKGDKHDRDSKNSRTN